MTDKKIMESYEAPIAATIAIVLEQCIASSTVGALKDMDNNNVYDEEF